MVDADPEPEPGLPTALVHLHLDDTDDVAVIVDERTAAIPRVEHGVGLQVTHPSAADAAVTHRRQPAGRLC